MDERIYVRVDGNICSMAKHTTRDKVWNAALEYAEEWSEMDRNSRESDYGFSPEELKREKDLDASEKTIADTLLTMRDMGWLSGWAGKGGNKSRFDKAG